MFALEIFLRASPQPFHPEEYLEIGIKEQKSLINQKNKTHFKVQVFDL